MQHIARSSLAAAVFGVVTLASPLAVPSAQAAGFTLSSPDIPAGGTIPSSPKPF